MYSKILLFLGVKCHCFQQIKMLINEQRQNWKKLSNYGSTLINHTTYNTNPYIWHENDGQKNISGHKVFSISGIKMSILLTKLKEFVCLFSENLELQPEWQCYYSFRRNLRLLQALTHLNFPFANLIMRWFDIKYFFLRESVLTNKVIIWFL